MLKLKPSVVLDYVANVLPKKVTGQLLNTLDCAVEKAVIAAEKNDQKGLQAARELICRLMLARK